MSRITPAYAGKSAADKKKLDGMEDHPRLCGEKPDWDGLDKTAQGSPPPMRGKVLMLKYDKDVSKDHPRLCGEKLFPNL